MQQISARLFGYHRETNVLSQEESTLRGQIPMKSMTQGIPFEVVGKRETRRYLLDKPVREQSRWEVGDILYWSFRPVDRAGRFVSGVEIRIYND